MPPRGSLPGSRSFNASSLAQTKKPEFPPERRCRHWATSSKLVNGFLVRVTPTGVPLQCTTPSSQVQVSGSPLTVTKSSSPSAFQPGPVPSRNALGRPAVSSPEPISVSEDTVTTRTQARVAALIRLALETIDQSGSPRLVVISQHDCRASLRTPPPAHGRELIEEGPGDQAVPPDRQIPGDDPAGACDLAAPVEHLLLGEAGRALAPGRAQVAQDVHLGTVHLPTLGAADHQPIQFIDLAGGIVFVRGDREDPVDHAGIEGDDAVGVARSCRGGEAGEVGRLLGAIHRVRPVAAV